LITALRQRSPQLAHISEFSLYSGLRLREILSIRWSNVNLELGVINVLDSKNNESRKIFITGPVQGILMEIGPGSSADLLFTNKFGQQVGWLSKAFKSVVDATGLNEGISDSREKVSFHSLRHTFASWAVMEGVPLYVLGKALGHKTSSMTERYSHLSPDSQRSVFEAVARSQSANRNAVEKTYVG
jgi:integrase